MRVLAALAAALGLALAAAACERGAPARGRVLLVGIDGATMKLAGPLLAEGRLPNLSRLAREGAHGPLESFVPLHSPRIWTTIATGKVPDKHGIKTFVHALADGSKALYLSSDRKAHALWNITSDAGLVTSVVNWWTTFPPERIEGVMVTDHLLKEELAKKRAAFGAQAPDPSAPTAHPEPWEARALAAARASDGLGPFPDPLAPIEGDPRWHEAMRVHKGWGATLRIMRETRETDDAVTRIALAVERELHPAVALVFLPGIDRISHFLWGAFERDPAGGAAGPPGRLMEGGSELATLRGYYEHTDRLLGVLLAAYGPEDLVLVVSDHGFERLEPTGSLVATGGHETEAASEGVLFARGPGIAPGGGTAGTTVNDVTPTILAWLGLPLGADMDGRPAAFLDRPAPKVIATYDTTPIARVPTESRGAEQERLEELRALGYIE